MQIFRVYIISFDSILLLKLDHQLILLRLLFGRISSASCEDMCLFTQDYAELSLFINENSKTKQKAFLDKKIHSDRSLYWPKKQKRISLRRKVTCKRF